MAQSMPLNVFKGSDSVARYFDPDEQPPTPLVEIPDRLNPLRDYNVRIFAKMLTALPAQNVKSLPALNMLKSDQTAASKSIVEASSGSTVMSMSILARVLWGNNDVCAYVTNKKHPDQLRLLRFFGLKVSLYGGLAQQEPLDPRGIMSRLRNLANKNEDVHYPGQYDNDNNWQAHVRWTGPQIYKQLPEINVLCTTVGTGGCITGTGVYLKSQKPSVKVVGVCNVFGDPTPGPRHFPKFESSPFPWRDAIDTFEEVASVDSYRTSMQLSREGIVCGPSSGEALHGLISYLNKMKDQDRLHELADPVTGEISCAFICCDLPYQYIDNYFQKLGENEFPEIYNKVLLNCDQDKYDERWELTPENAFEYLPHSGNRLCNPSFLPPSPPLTPSTSPKRSGCVLCSRMSTADIIDLRQPQDYSATHVIGARNYPLVSLSPSTGDIYEKSEKLSACWQELKMLFDREEAYGWLAKRKQQSPLGGEEANMWLPDAVNPDKTWTKTNSVKPLVVICYDGEVARLATASLRNRGHEAYSIEGGFRALSKLEPHQ